MKQDCLRNAKFWGVVVIIYLINTDKYLKKYEANQ